MNDAVCTITLSRVIWPISLHVLVKSFCCSCHLGQEAFVLEFFAMWIGKDGIRQSYVRSTIYAVFFLRLPESVNSEDWIGMSIDFSFVSFGISWLAKTTTEHCAEFFHFTDLRIQKCSKKTSTSFAS
jgi:hypothetical protein